MQSHCRVDGSCGGSAQFDLHPVLRAKRLVIGGGSRVTILYFTPNHIGAPPLERPPKLRRLSFSLLQSRSDIVAVAALNVG